MNEPFWTVIVCYHCSDTFCVKHSQGQYWCPYCGTLLNIKDMSLMNTINDLLAGETKLVVERELKELGIRYE